MMQDPYLVVDGRNALDIEELLSLGYIYSGIGRYVPRIEKRIWKGKTSTINVLRVYLIVMFMKLKTYKLDLLVPPEWGSQSSSVIASTLQSTYR